VDVALLHNLSSVAIAGPDAQISTQWTVVKTEASVQRFRLDSLMGDVYPAVGFTFHLQRNSASFSAVVVIPGLVMMTLTLATFWLPPNSAEKMWTGLMDVLLICLYLLRFDALLPSSSDHCPHIVSFFGGLLVLVAVSLLLNTVALRWLRLPKGKGPPLSVRTYSGRIVGRVLFLADLIHQIEGNYATLSGVVGTELPVSGRPPPSEPPSEQTAESFYLEWLILAAAVDRLALVVYCALFAVISICYV